MNKWGGLIILFLSCGICNSQNLVPNGDFEQYASCPDDVDQINLALFWMNPAISPTNGGTGGSPDYFNFCAFTGIVSVPMNFAGYQSAHSGDAYCGLASWGAFTSDFREYIEVPLSSTLIANTCYHFEMYVNLPNNVIYTSDALSVYFSDTIISNINNCFPLPFTPQINNSIGLITDTLNWVIINGNYTATGGENYLIIGNFKYDAATIVIIINGNASNDGAYFFIDDVSLTPCTGINENNKNESIVVFPNPFSDKLNITIKNNELSEIILYDITSRKLLQQKFTNSISLNTEQLSKGIYMYEMKPVPISSGNKKGVIKKGKAVKQ